jgi:hypothetical protein
MTGILCDNANHGRANIPIRTCPDCGKMLNDRIPAGRCSAEKHVTKRRQQSKYCCDCGEALAGKS